ncbi:hypothetical protein Rsub_12432 [Raphidocelis subcapitata]|uniref:CARDB domain-containing protein n=1 Tax=Raphidocelis subcapitata TaxID=307507 RepID=A0A2V0PJJ5_9CHLO|nr:hypothetical protein Rsub_12432 [Raphidocelis subcapitata]|eukprot:GBF99719.1 hypothetical protein Rsub_12432 [Raphidocelis subcapitata]
MTPRCRRRAALLAALVAVCVQLAGQAEAADLRLRLAASGLPFADSAAVLLGGQAATLFGALDPPKPAHPQPEASVQLTLWVFSEGNQTTPEGVKVAFYNDYNPFSGAPMRCGDPGSPTVVAQLPPIDPLRIYKLQVSLPARASTGQAFFNAIVDVDCRANPYVAYGSVHQYLVTPPDQKAPDLTPTGIILPLALMGSTLDTGPTTPVANATAKMAFGVWNAGNAPSPAGVTVVLYSDVKRASWPGCNKSSSGFVTATLPSIGPGKTHKVKVEAVAAATPGKATAQVVVDPDCRLPSLELGRPRLLAYETSEALPRLTVPQALKKMSIGWEVSTAPGSPKPGASVSVKARVTNQGAVEGTPGKLLVYLAPYTIEGGVVAEPVSWTGCGNYTGQTADFSSVVVKPGKAKKLKVKRVPLPADAAPGSWWMAGVLVDVDCSNNNGAPNFNSGTSYFNTFPVKA